MNKEKKADLHESAFLKVTQNRPEGRQDFICFSYLLTASKK